MRFLMVAAALLFPLFGVTAPARAAPYAGEIIGGPGGESFTIACPANQALVGIAARSGRWIDAVMPLCGGAKWTIAQEQGWAGGAGGSPNVVRCSPGTFVGRMMIATTTGNARTGTINSIGIICTDKRMVCLSTGEGCAGSPELAPGEYGADVVTARTVYCKPSEVMVGLVGRAGDLLDAVGGLCGTAPMAKLMDLPVRPGRPELGWPAPTAKSAATAASACRAGFVWREAAKDDHVCVPPAARDRVRAENMSASANIDPASAFGPKGCKAGYVWREAFPGDLICVTPAARDLAREENARAGERG